MTLTELLLAVLDARAGGPPAREAQLALPAELGRLIAQRVRAVEMWNQPPAYFGYPDLRHWRDAFPADVENSAVEYATADVTVDFFADKLLKAVGKGGKFARLLQRAKSSDPEVRTAAARVVPAYIVRMIQNFLVDRQKRQDPVGYRVFANLEAVVEALAAAGTVEVTGREERKGKPPRIRRTSVVRFRSATPTDAPRASVDKLVLGADCLRGAVHRLSKEGTGAQQLLREALETLPAAGVEGFEFGELLVPLQAAVRDAARLWAEGAEPVRAEAEGPDGEKISADFRIASRPASYSTLDEYLEVLTREVRLLIDAQVAQERRRNGLHRVLTDWFEHLSETGADEGQAPTLKEWGIRLGVQKSTLHEYLEQLRTFIRQVQARLDGTGQ